MANFETSFIPEQGATYQGGSRRSIVATVFSIIIAVIAVGLSAYSWWIQRQEELKVKQLNTELTRLEEGYDIEKIAMLGRLDKRIALAKDMFSKHPMPSLIIDYITDNTVSTVKWKSITYTRATADEGSGDTVELSGEGVGYSALVQQLNQFRAKATEISKVDLKSYRMDPRTNTVSIQMTLSIKPTFATFNTVRQKNITATEQDVITNDVVQPIAPATVPAPAIIQPKTPVVNPAQAQVILTPTQGTSSKPQSATSTN
jgi:hypothetical protein